MLGWEGLKDLGRDTRQGTSPCPDELDEMHYLVYVMYLGKVMARPGRKATRGADETS